MSQRINYMARGIVNDLGSPARLKQVLQENIRDIRKASFSGESVELSPFEQVAVDIYQLPAHLLEKKFGETPISKLARKIGELPSKVFVEIAGLSQKNSQSFGLQPDPFGIRGKIREASAPFVLPLVAAVAIPAGITAYKSYQTNKGTTKSKKELAKKVGSGVIKSYTK